MKDLAGGRFALPNLWHSTSVETLPGFGLDYYAVLVFRTPTARHFELRCNCQAMQFVSSVAVYKHCLRSGLLFTGKNLALCEHGQFKLSCWFPVWIGLWRKLTRTLLFAGQKLPCVCAFLQELTFNCKLELKNRFEVRSSEKKPDWSPVEPWIYGRVQNFSLNPNIVISNLWLTWISLRSVNNCNCVLFRVGFAKIPELIFNRLKLAPKEMLIWI